MSFDQKEIAAQAAAEKAFDYVYLRPAASAQEIAENVSEPTVLLEEIIKAVYSGEPLKVVKALLDKEVRNYANQQSELAYNAVINEPR